MKKFAAIALVAVLASAAFGQIAATDFYQVETLRGPNAYMDLSTHSGSIVATGVASAEWTTGSDLTLSGTPGTNSIWATGWTGEAGDYAKLTVVLESDYEAQIDALRYGLRASGTGPDFGFNELFVNGVSQYYRAEDVSDGSYHNIWDSTNIAVPAGATIELIFTADNATSSSSGSYRIATYYDGNYYPTGILGTTSYVPEPASLVLLALGALVIRRR